jgi:ABC-type transporter MlaC component
VARNVDVDRLVPYLVGPAWDEATPGERLSLKSAYRWYAARIYSKALIDRFVDGYAITRVDHRDDGRITVITKVHSRYDPRDVSYAWTVVRYRDSGFRIFDVSEAGRSLAEAVRKDCREIIAQDGIQGLIRSLYRAAAQP